MPGAVRHNGGMVGIVDYGMGNLGSVENAFRFLEVDTQIITCRRQMDRCRAMVLPGVGGFSDCMRHLETSGFSQHIQEWISAGRPFMGICLGLQVLFESSEESPGVQGLGIFKGTARRFKLKAELKVPQIGWNRLHINRPDCPMFEGIEDQTHFYLVHSYYVMPAERAIAVGTTDYGIKYCSCIWRDNVFATQFHPEKSQAPGLRMLRNFERHAPCLFTT